MSRIEIQLPVKFIFSTQIPIRIGDINRGSHLSHVNLVQILEEARAQFLITLGYGDAVKILHGKLGFMLGDMGVIFKKQALYGQILQVDIGAMDFKEKSFDMVYKVSDSVSKVEVARAKTGILVFDYSSQQVIPVPVELRDRFS